MRCDDCLLLVPAEIGAIKYAQRKAEAQRDAIAARCQRLREALEWVRFNELSDVVREFIDTALAATEGGKDAGDD